MGSAERHARAIFVDHRDALQRPAEMSLYRVTLSGGQVSVILGDME